MIADMAGVDRTPAKTISLGVLYGMGIAKMMASLGFDSEHSGEVLNKYFHAAPYFKELAEIAMETAAERGYVKTILGRRRRFTDSRFMHKALNAIVQGSAGDEIKQAMWNIWCSLEMVPLLTVHDELGFSGPADMAKDLAHQIETAIEFVIPIIVDPVCSPNWNAK
jgi:DNA polymerase-1